MASVYRAKHSISNLELHLVHGCNFRCVSCSHYSNQPLPGMVSLADADRWLAAWGDRLSPRVFSLLGGEPTLHPDLPKFLTLARQHWPQAELRLVTNGSLLHKHPELPSILHRDRNVSLFLSLHHSSPAYGQFLQPILHLLGDWTRRWSIRVRFYDSYNNWTRRYWGEGNSMMPYNDGNPRRSWEICEAKAGPQLFEGKLWKCAPLAYLKLVDRKYGLAPAWAPYLAYQPLAPDCTDEELASFLAREEESACGMCPAQREPLALPLPFPSPAPPPIPAAWPRLTSGVYPLKVSDSQGCQGWRMFPIFQGTLGGGIAMRCHASVLSPGWTPHPPHTHTEEEILIVLTGEVELQIAAGRSESSHYRVRAGTLAYYPTHQPHTLRNVGKQPAAYVMFKWQGDGRLAARGSSGTRIVSFGHRDSPPVASGQPGFFPLPLLEGATHFLRRLEAHTTVLQPGAGYPVHADAYDVAIVLLRGTVETLDRRLSAGNIIYYAAGEPHGMRNVGAEPAFYLVFEFQP